ncbi:hypothetical protein CWB96_00865 [Pseudoalteromonas citrea]|uniref:DUF304 domain-containing protein n=1 Tax=Pseudoalteromonas citrea TaxID=43655 RepID=A0A5S3XUZ7_9GAMM|nr:hypothetical protein [Pseudoalteromonas citrea]TMP40699.1 hypothetical protein CWB97_17225 [Pseudoalteromonas citrea]TMP62625.1 hypothetical protein CWB96_00865 [Pseudoalteromonas citrea]
MKTIDLTVNWMFYSTLLLVCIIIYGVSQTSPLLSNILTISSYLLLAGVLVSLSLAVINRRYVHLDKAGISYSTGLNTQYIPSDAIVDIQLLQIGFIKVLEVQLSDHTKTRFYSWMMSNEELQRTKKIISEQ